MHRSCLRLHEVNLLRWFRNFHLFGNWQRRSLVLRLLVYRGCHLCRGVITARKELLLTTGTRIKAKKLLVDRVYLNHVLIDALFSLDHNLRVNLAQLDLLIYHAALNQLLDLLWIARKLLKLKQFRL